MSSKNIKIIIVIIIIVITFFGFKMFFVTDTSTTATVVENGATPDFVDGQVILNLLNQLKQVTLDDSIFSSAAFVSLKGVDRELESQVVGRDNPFQPIGVVGSGIAPRVATTTKPR